MVIQVRPRNLQISPPPAAAREPRQDGFTLIELLIYMGILLILTAPITFVFLVSIRTNLENDAMGRVAERNRVALSRVSDDIRPALRDTVTVSSDGTILALTLPDGFDGAAVIPGSRIQLRLVPASGEQQNGADDNGNGLVDEGQLVRWNIDTGESVAICQGIDLAQSRFERIGDEINVRITNGGKRPHGDSVYSVSRSAVIVPRN